MINKILKLFDSHLSPLHDLMFSGEIINYACLYLVYFLIIQLIYRLYFKENITLNLSKFLGNKINTKIEIYLNKIITINKKSSIVWIWYSIIFITWWIVGDALSLYNICKYINILINEHISSNPDFKQIDNSIWNANFTIVDLLFNIRFINYISLISIFSLILILILKLHFNKNINNVFIWLILVILMITLAINAVTYGEIYTNINSYITIYINLINK